MVSIKKQFKKKIIMNLLFKTIIKILTKIYFGKYNFNKIYLFELV